MQGEEVPRADLFEAHKLMEDGDVQYVEVNTEAPHAQEDEEEGLTSRL